MKMAVLVDHLIIDQNGNEGRMHLNCVQVSTALTLLVLPIRAYRSAIQGVFYY
jgi:hypothetical protein